MSSTPPYGQNDLLSSTPRAVGLQELEPELGGSSSIASGSIASSSQGSKSNAATLDLTPSTSNARYDPPGDLQMAEGPAALVPQVTVTSPNLMPVIQPAPTHPTPQFRGPEWWSPQRVFTPPRPEDLTLDPSMQDLRFETTPAQLPAGSPVWQTYMDTARIHDSEKTASWSRDMEALLVFAGLFSAILTAFLIQFYQTLQPDPQQQSLDKLSVIAQLLEVSLGNENANQAPTASRVLDLKLITAIQDEPFQPPTMSVIVNAIWFSSLILSLGAAIGSILVKQWLQLYAQGMSSSPYEFAHQHRYRYSALLDWRVPAIVSALPLIMLLSVGLFLIGLGFQLSQINYNVAVVAITCMACIGSCYITSLLLSILWPSCPYKTSATQLWRIAATQLWRMVATLLKAIQRGGQNLDVAPPTSDLDYREVREIQRKQRKLTTGALLWLCDTSKNHENTDLLIRSVRGWTSWHDEQLIHELQKHHIMDRLLYQACTPLPPLLTHLDDWEARLEREFSPTSPCFRIFEETMPYMDSLLNLWHHPSYLSRWCPEPISESYTKDRLVLIRSKGGKTNATTSGKSHNIFHRLYAKRAFITVLTPELFLLGDWILLWRELEKTHNGMQNLLCTPHNINIYVYIACLEAYHYHLNWQKNLNRDSPAPPEGERRLNQALCLNPNQSTYYDICRLLNAYAAVEFPEFLGRQIYSICLLVDTLAAVFTEMDHITTEHSFAVIRAETVKVLLALGSKNEWEYNLLSKKILLCLRMLLAVGTNRRELFINNSTEISPPAEFIQEIIETLVSLAATFACFVETKLSAGPGYELNQVGHPPLQVAYVALQGVLLQSMKTQASIKTIVHLLTTHNLPAAYLDRFFKVFNREFEESTLPGLRTVAQDKWLLELLTEWYKSDTLSKSNADWIVCIIRSVCRIHPNRPLDTGIALLFEGFQFFAALFKKALNAPNSTNIDYSSAILAGIIRECLLYNQLDSHSRIARREEIVPSGALDQLFRSGAYDALLDILESPEHTSKMKSDWRAVAKVWAKKVETPAGEKHWLVRLQEAVGLEGKDKHQATKAEAGTDETTQERLVG